MLKTLFLVLFILISTQCFSWEEDPRIEAHNKLTEYLIKLEKKQIEEKDETTMSFIRFMYEELQKKKEEKSDE